MVNKGLKTVNEKLNVFRGGLVGKRKFPPAMVG